MDSVELMYEHHAAREDTVVFPAWKDALSANQLDEMGETFEEIENQQFGKDGFEDAVAQIAQSNRRSASPTSRNSPRRRRRKGEVT